MTPRLLTIPISHYCEKARWALDLAGVRYEEERHLQAFHWRHVRRAGGARTVPVLVTDEGPPLVESTAIMEWADRRGAVGLFGEGAARLEIDRWVSTFDQPFGVESRKLAYFHFNTAAPAMINRYNAAGVPLLERVAFAAVLPLAKKFLLRKLRVTPASVERARDSVTRTFDQVAERLAGGARFLVGDRFTAADLTFAALAAPLVLPRSYGTPLPDLHELPAAYADDARTFRAHPAGVFALRMFAEERGRRGHPA